MARTPDASTWAIVILFALLTVFVLIFAAFTPEEPKLSIQEQHARWNRIWWEVEQSNSQVVAIYETRVRSDAPQQELIRVMMECDHEVRGRIGARYGLSYEQVKRIHNEGLDAPWRTDRPPR